MKPDKRIPFYRLLVTNIWNSFLDKTLLA